MEFTPALLKRLEERAEQASHYSKEEARDFLKRAGLLNGSNSEPPKRSEPKKHLPPMPQQNKAS